MYKIMLLTPAAILLLCVNGFSLTNAELKDISNKITDQVNKKSAVTLGNIKESSNLRSAALKTLTKAREKAIVPILAAIVTDKNEDFKFRVQALNSLLEMDKEGSDEVLIIAGSMFSSLSRSTNPERANSWLEFDGKEKPMVFELITALGKTKRPEALELMDIPLKCKETRALCPVAMGDLGKPAIPLLLTLLGNKDTKVRKSACIGLGKLKDTLVAPALMEVIMEEKNVGIRIEAAKSLALIGDPRALPYLEKAKKEANLKEEIEEYEKTIKAIKAVK